MVQWMVEVGMIDLGSVYRGIRVMKRPYVKPVPGWSVHFSWWGWPWVDAWTPAWHRGRGPYVSIGFGFIAMMRGY